MVELVNASISGASVSSGPLSLCSPTGTNAEDLTPLSSWVLRMASGVTSFCRTGFWGPLWVPRACISRFSLASSFVEPCWDFGSKLESPFGRVLEAAGFEVGSGWWVCLGSSELDLGHLGMRSCSDTNVIEFLQRPYFM